MTRFLRICIVLVSVTASLASEGAPNIDAWQNELLSCYKTALQKDPNASVHPCKRKVEKKRLGRDVVRNGSDLVISLSNGSRKVLSDACKQSVADAEKCSSEVKPFYTYVGYFPSISHYLVLVEDSIETESKVLVDSHSGKESVIQDSPIFSPDGKSFVTASEDLYAGYRANGLEIWTLKNGELIKQASINLKMWGPKDPVWMNQNLIEVKQMCPQIVTSKGKSITTSVKNGSARLALSKGVWSVEAGKCP